MVRCLRATFLAALAAASTARGQVPAAGPPSAESLRDYAAYLRVAEARVAGILQDQRAFLWADTPEKRARVRQEAVVSEPRNNKGNFAVAGGTIHDWVGATFISGATIAQVLAPIQDYDNHKNTYGPEVIDSKTIERHGNDFKVRLRLVKRKVVTVVMEVDSDVRYQPLAGGDWYSWAHGTRLVEIADAGGPRERVRPAAEDRGFLWRLDSFWLFRQKDGGVYVECEAVSLSRGIPSELAWLIEPITRSLPRDELVHTLSATRALVLSRSTAH